jgi:tRNA nucleotidyltransferase (CCA-adding enzyme)
MKTQRYTGEIPQPIAELLYKLNSRYYHAFLVGGCVRDMCLGLEPKDFDIEVFNVTSYEELFDFLKSLGVPHVVGEAFGVTKLRYQGFDVDIALPRRDSKVQDVSVGRGRGFEVETDPFMSLEDACARRDFTINALMYDIRNNLIMDHFSGLDDIRYGILRATSDKFEEDPLRVLRGFQFAARLGFSVDPETAKMCARLKNSELVKERVYEEWIKFFTKAKYPSKGIQFLIETEWIDNYPELKGMIDVPQDPIWHPEGGCMSHTLHACNAVVELFDFSDKPQDWVVAVNAAILLHDVGKPDVTRQEWDADTQSLRWRSKGHSAAGLKLAESFLKRIGMKPSITQVVQKLVLYHMDYISYKEDRLVSTMRGLAENLYPATIEQLYVIITGDSYGRPPLEGKLEEKFEVFFRYARENGLWEGKPKLLVSGMDILNRLPNAPKDKRLGDTIKFVQNLYLSGKIHTKEEGLKKATSYLRHVLQVVNGNDLMDLGIPQGPQLKPFLELAWEIQNSEGIQDKVTLLKLIGVV